MNVEQVAEQIAKEFHESYERQAPGVAVVSDLLERGVITVGAGE